MVEHMLDDLLDDDGWIVAVCACGLASGPCPDAATAANFWGQHLLYATRGEVQRQALDPWEDDDNLCQCGYLMEWADCWAGCDDGYVQPLLDDLGPWPDDPWVPCDTCDGQGGWYWCPREATHQPADSEATP